MAAAAPPEQTLIPFDQLPACARQCGKLFDVNGACVPPAAPRTQQQDYVDCFCDDPRLAPFKTGTTGVCDNICADAGSDATTEDALKAIQSWFDTFCKTEASDQAPASGGSSGAKSKSNGGGDWLSTHWQWVVMLVILVVGIAAIWIGACIWRRHYLKKKERAHALGKNAARSSGATASWGPGAAPADGAFMSPPHGQGAHTEKQAKRVSKWIPKERT